MSFWGNAIKIPILLGKANDTTYLQRCFVCTLYESEERSLSRNTIFCLFGCAFFHAGAARLAKNRHYNDLPDISQATHHCTIWLYEMHCPGAEADASSAADSNFSWRVPFQPTARIWIRLRKRRTCPVNWEVSRSERQAAIRRLKDGRGESRDTYWLRRIARSGFKCCMLLCKWTSLYLLHQVHKVEPLCNFEFMSLLRSSKRIQYRIEALKTSERLIEGRDIKVTMITELYENGHRTCNDVMRLEY